MVFQPLNIGTVSNDGTGDTLRSAGTKINANFLELYNRTSETLWGAIGGVLSDQADLQTALNTKLTSSDLEPLQLTLDTQASLIATQGLAISNLEDDLVTQLNRLIATEENLVALDTRLDSAETTLVTQSELISDLDTDLGLAEATLVTQGETLVTLDSRLDTAEATLVTQGGLISGLDTDLSTAETTLMSLDGRLDTAESTLVSLDGRLDTLEVSEVFGPVAALRVFAGPGFGQPNTLPTFRLLNNSDIPSLDAGKIGSGTLSINRIPILDSSKVPDLLTLDSRLDTAEATLITQGETLGDLDTRLDATELTLTSLDGELTTAQGELVTLDSRLDAIEPTVSNHGTRLNNVELATVANLQYLDGQVGALDTRLDTAEATLVSLDGRLDTLEAGGGIIDINSETSGILEASRIANLDAAKITSGTLDILRIPSIPTSIITGTLPASQVADLDAAKITTGIIAEARLPTIGALANNQAANRVFAGPSSGGSTNPTFRSLVEADIPGIGASKVTSGTFSASRIPSLSTLAGSQTAKFVWAAPNAANGSPSFRALVESDLPNLDAAKIASGNLAVARMPVGSVINKVVSKVTTTFTTNLATFQASGFTINYTPLLANSLIRVIFNTAVSAEQATSFIDIAMYRNGVNPVLGVLTGDSHIRPSNISTGAALRVNIEEIFTPGATTLQTFELYVRRTGGSGNVKIGGRAQDTNLDTSTFITIEEIKQS